jgi:SnoaL-like domain
MLPTPEDRGAISDLLARYCLTLDLDDVDGWVALFTPDARYHVYGRSFDGHEGLRRMMTAAPGGLHLGGPPVIDVLDDDHARTTRNLLFVERGGAEQRSAVYTDDLVRTGDGWRIASCRCQFIVADGLSERPG